VEHPLLVADFVKTLWLVRCEMGADRWSICPKCKRVANESRDKAIRKAKASYGKVTEEVYREAIEAAGKPVCLKETFREDYQQGMDDDGTYSVSYSGRCLHCGFSHEYTFSQDVLKSEKQTR
jgi:hypothetical protein